MSDENAVKTGGNQASIATASNQNSTITSNQRNDDFVLDFGENDASNIEELKTNISDKNENSLSDGGDIGNSDGNELFSGLDDNKDSLNGDDLFGSETENIGESKNIEDNENIEESENVKDSENDNNEDNVNNLDNEGIEPSETTERDDGDELFSGLDDNDKDPLGGDDLFDGETESIEENKNIEDNESTEPSEHIEDNYTVPELNSDDNFGIDLDSSSNDDSMDSNQFDLDDNNVDSNEEDDGKESTDSEGHKENEDFGFTNTESDSGFQMDLDSSLESGEDVIKPTDLDLIGEETNNEGISDNEIGNEQSGDNKEVNDVNFPEDGFNNKEMQNENIESNETLDEINNNTLGYEWNDENLENSTDDESFDNGNGPADIDFTENVSNEENSNEINNSDILGNVDFSNNLNDTNETIENNVNENSEQNPEDVVDVEFNLTDSSNPESDLLQNNSVVEGIDNNDINQNNEAQLNNSLDSNESDDSQTLGFDLSSSSETEENIEQQPNIQDYFNDQTSDEVPQSFEEETQEPNEVPQSFEEESQEPSQTIDTTNFYNDSSNENKDSDSVLDNSQPESMSFDLNESQPVDKPIEETIPEAPEQDTPTNQENTEASNGFSLDFTENNANSDSNTQEPINQDAPQENQFTTLPTESNNSSTEIDNSSATSETTDGGISLTLGERESNNKSEIEQIQATLSLDQLLDSELSSNPKYSNNSVAVSEDTGDKKSKSNKLGIVLAGGLFVVAGIVAVLAFPSLLSITNSGGTDDSGDDTTMENHGAATDTGFDNGEPEFPNPDFPEPDDFTELNSPDTFTTGNDSGVTSLGGATAHTTVEFPDPYGGMDDDEWINGLNDDPEPTPYIGDSDDIVYEEDPEEYEQILINDIKSSISSFKSDAEGYYSYGQEHSDRRIIKYASQIIYACDTYESQISSGEGISQEALSEFESKMLDIFNKIDDYNNGGSEAPQVIQNITTTNEDDNESIEKDEIREYLYSRE